MLNTDASVKTLPGGVANPIPVGGTTRADEFCYDPKDNLIMIASPAEDAALRHLHLDHEKPIQSLASSCLTARRAARTPPTASSSADGVRRPENFIKTFPRSTAPAMIRAPGAVAVINPKTMKVDELFPVPLEDCAGPQGMAIGPDDQILLGCNAASPDGHRNTVVINEKNGNILAVLQDLGGADEVWFNPGRRPLHHPFLQHGLPHSSSAICHHWSRGTRDRRLKHTPAGPIGFCRGAEQRHDRYHG